MSKIVLVRDGIVVNYFFASDAEKNEKILICQNAGYTVVENDQPLVGWTYKNGIFSPPEEVPPVGVATKHITKLAFRNRFTSTEKINIELAALDDPTASAQQRQNAALVRVYVKDIDAATFIDLDRQETKDGVQNLETVGLLAAGRANEILTAKIQPSERYRG